ncbi:MAG: hypothetical protein M9914_09890 [Trueperaceae bacterium]|jgi:hypothetical protein|nr:hypothetical protein [Trueperaceae bacterium]
MTPDHHGATPALKNGHGNTDSAKRPGDGNELNPRRLPATPTELATAIHSTPHKMVMAFAGAGAQALAWLHGVGGSSRTILSAVDVYNEESMRDWVGFMPARFTSRRVARAMARRAYQQARRYAKAADAVFGLGSTATIATDRAKRGEHRVAAAVQDSFGMTTYSLTIEKDARDRAGEEELVSLLLLRVAAEACGVLARPELPLTASERLEIEFQPSELIAAVERGERDAVIVRSDGSVVGLPRAGAGQRMAVLSGAFNPAHEGHLALAQAASEHVGLPPLFELPLVNAEKAPIGLFEARLRAQQFAGRGSLALTRAALFVEKAALFPGSVFVVGVDTAERILEPRFYGGSEAAMRSALEAIGAHGCRFLVAGRLDEAEGYKTLRRLKVPPEVARLFEELPERSFRHDVSSTEIRAGWAGRA